MATQTQTQTPEPLSASLQDYAVHMVLPTGGIAGLRSGSRTEWNITQLVTSMNWTDSFDQPATQLDLTISAAPVRKDLDPSQAGVQGGKVVDVREMLNCGCAIKVYGAQLLPSGGVRPLRGIGNGRWDPLNELFRGYVFDLQRAASPAGDALQVTAYDAMIYMSLNDFDVVYKNKTATEIIRDLLSQAGIVPDPRRFVDTRVALPRLVTNGLSLYDACYLAIQRTQDLTGRRYRLRMERGRAVLMQRDLAPDDYYLLTSTGSLTAASTSRSILDLATRVTLKSDGTAGRTTERTTVPTAATRLLEARYGRISKIIDRGATQGTDAATTVENYMNEHGQPHEEVTVSTICINVLRAGDYLRVVDEDTGLHTHLWVDSVAHNVGAAGATSDLTLVKRIAEADVDEVVSSDGTPATTRWLAERDGKNRPVRYRVTVRVYTPSGVVGNTEFDGDEDVATVLAGGVLAHTVDRRLRMSNDNSSVQVRVIGTHTDDMDVRLSKHAADRISAITGQKVFATPLRPVTSGGSGATTVDTSGSPTTYDSQIVGAAQANGLSPSLVKAIMKAESAFSPSARSPAGAVGLMQILPATAAGLGWTAREGDLSTPSVNIKYGAKYLGQLSARFHQTSLVIAAYNAGPGAVEKYGGIPPYAETQAYVPRVTGYMNQFLAGGLG